MKTLREFLQKETHLGIGLMSGTSLDGMDAALVEIEGAGLKTRLEFRDFISIPYDDEVRGLLLNAASGEWGGGKSICLLNTLVGELALEACLDLCEKAGIRPEAVDFAGSHGQTIYHIPEAEALAGRRLRGTLQIGEASIIAEGLGCPVVSDFRVRDMAAGGQGAPLVPYTEYLLYRRLKETVALQNIGGIGNITILPAGCGAGEVLAFDTGPGNMIIDALVREESGGKRVFDQDGLIAARGKPSEPLLDFMREKDGDYLRRPPPKTTGRELYNTDYVRELKKKAGGLGLSFEDTVATATFYTAWTVKFALETFCPKPAGETFNLYIGGGGVHNPVLMAFFRNVLPQVNVLPSDALGVNADAKEAAAFAVLAHECLHGVCNNAPSATGARHPAVLGKISL